MGKIREALQSELDSGHLSEQAKREIVAKSRKGKFRYVPVVTLLVTCLAMFFIWSEFGGSVTDETESISAEYGDVKYLEEAVVELTNATIVAAEQNKWNPLIGDVFAMRLALEQNTGLFYLGSMLSREHQMLLSEFLHYLQVAHVAEMDLTLLQTFRSVEDIVEAAPTFIQQVIDEEGETYKSIRAEKRYVPLVDWHYYEWLQFVLITLIGSYLFVWLWRHHYRVPPILLAIVGCVLLVPTIFNLNNDVGYDEATMAEVMKRKLEHDVRLVGEPTIEAVAGFNGGRYILLSYEDGLNVFGEFSNRNGQYEYQGASWHSGDRFSAVEYLYEGDEKMETMHIFATMRSSSYKKLTIDSNLGTDVLPLKQEEATILLYKTKAKEMELQYE